MSENLRPIEISRELKLLCALLTTATSSIHAFKLSTHMDCFYYHYLLLLFLCRTLYVYAIICAVDSDGT
jgi:hypothetical protein